MTDFNEEKNDAASYAGQPLTPASEISEDYSTWHPYPKEKPTYLDAWKLYLVSYPVKNHAFPYNQTVATWDGSRFMLNRNVEFFLPIPPLPEK